MSKSSRNSRSSKSSNLISNTDKTNDCNTTYCGSLLDKKLNNSFSKHEKEVKDLIKNQKIENSKIK
jgi:hypothetical protein